MNRIHWTVGAIAGGLAGALIWVLVGYFTHYEVGWIAWGVGALTGIGANYVAQQSGSDGGPMHGLVAALIAIASIVGAKFTVAYLDSGPNLQISGEFGPVTDDMLVGDFADKIVQQRTDAGKPPKLPETPDLENISRNYPSDIWKSAKARFAKLSADQREKMRTEFDAERRRNFADFQKQIAAKYAADATPKFGLYDILWVGLAMVTAYKIGSGTYGGA